MMDRNSLRTIGLYTILILMVIKFVYLPINSNIKNYRETLQQKIESYKIKQSSYNNLLARLSVSQQKGNDFVSKLVFNQDVSEAYIQTALLEHSQKAIKETKLEMLTFELPPFSDREGLREVSVLLRIKGSPKEIFEFIEKCKKYEKLTTVRSFENTRSSDTDATMFFKVKLSTYKLVKEDT